MAPHFSRGTALQSRHSTHVALLGCDCLARYQRLDEFAMKVRFAVTPPSAVFATADVFTEYLHACESIGFDTLWLSDVPLGPLGDPLISLAFAAAATKKLKLGMNVVPLGRNPLWLAKQLAQLDRLSNGRLLISLVPGLGQPQERAALGHSTGDRGKVIDTMIPLLRTWWKGEAVIGDFESLRFDDVTVAPTPLQDPLEIWLGGIGPAALDRVARLADGWLTANATPDEANAGRLVIEQRAEEVGRVVDQEHFGISIPYATTEPPEAALTAMRKRRGGDGDLRQILPVGNTQLNQLLSAHIDCGLSKFVVRPVSTGSASWHDELQWLADAILPLQT
jgi:probable F420-dependent oxidoreductase